MRKCLWGNQADYPIDAAHSAGDQNSTTFAGPTAPSDTASSLCAQLTAENTSLHTGQSRTGHSPHFSQEN